ncbi:MAG: DUF1540 domain-containing protein [Bacillota bacterium]|nr:MAG: DUF1540 domain-containing protein [Bacillota bacterium]
MPEPVVRCEVDTCTHWLPGNVCAANNIDILYEEEGKMAQSPEQTECKTFYNRRGVTSYLGSMDNVNWLGMVEEPLMTGRQTTPTVTCTVESCRFWREGDLCDADEIKVSGQGANECQDTNCGTYEEERS